MSTIQDGKVMGTVAEAARLRREVAERGTGTPPTSTTTIPAAPVTPVVNTPQQQAAAQNQQATPVVTTPVTPVVTAPVAPIVQPKPVAPKPIAPAKPQYDYISADPTRLQEVQSNLDDILTKQPDLVNDRKTFDTYFAYNKRGAEQKQIIDNTYNTKKQYQKSITDARKYDGVSDKDIALGISTGGIEMSDSGLNGLSVTNPDRYNKIMALKVANDKATNMNNSLSGSKVEDNAIVAPVSSIMDVITKITETIGSSVPPNIQEVYDREVGNTENKALSDEINVMKGELDKLELDKSYKAKDLQDHFDGTGADAQHLGYAIQDEIEGMDRSIAARSIAMNTKIALYNSRASDGQNKVDNIVKQYSMDMQQQQQKMETLKFGYNVVSDEQKRQDSFKLADLQFKQDIQKMTYGDKLKEGDINSDDPYLKQKAIQTNVDSLMQQYDGLIESSRDQLVDRITTDMKGGKSYGESLGSIMTDIEEKTIYSAWLSNKQGFDTKPYSLGDGLIGIPDGKGNYKVVTTQQFKDKNNVPSAEMEALRRQMNAERAMGGSSQYDDSSNIEGIRNDPKLGVGVDSGTQCAGYTTAVAAKIGLKGIVFGNTSQDKINTINKIGFSPLPVVGGFVAIKTGATYKDRNGKDVLADHTGFVTWVSPDGSRMKVLNSNYSGKSTIVTENEFSTSSVLAASIAPGKGSAGQVTNTSTSKFSAGDINMFNGNKYNVQTDKDPARIARYYDFLAYKSSVIAGENPDIKALMNLSQGNKDLGTSDNKIYKDLGTVSSQLTSMIPKIQENRKSSWGGDLLGPIAGVIANKNPRDSKAQNIKAELQGLVPKIARGVFGEVGVLTDADIKNYIQTLPNIKQTADVQDVVALSILGTLQTSLENAIRTDSATYNVSGLLPQYNNITSQVSALKAKILENSSVSVQTNSSNVVAPKAYKPSSIFDGFFNLK